MDTKERQSLVSKMRVSPAHIVEKLANIIYKDFNEFADYFYICKRDRLIFELHYDGNSCSICYPLETTKDGKAKLGEMQFDCDDESALTIWESYIDYIQYKLPDDILQRLTHNTDDAVKVYDVIDWGTTNITQDLLTQDLIAELKELPDLPNWDAPRADIVKYVIDYFGYDQKDFDADKIAKSLQDDYY